VPDKWESFWELQTKINDRTKESLDASLEPPVVLEVYTGGSINLSDLKIPAGVHITDKRKKP